MDDKIYMRLFSLEKFKETQKYRPNIESIIFELKGKLPIECDLRTEFRTIENPVNNVIDLFFTHPDMPPYRWDKERKEWVVLNV